MGIVPLPFLPLLCFSGHTEIFCAITVRFPPLLVEPVDYPLTVQVLKATADLGGVEDGPLLVEARVAHVVDVKL